MRELHLIFFTSDNRKHKEVLKHIKDTITPEEVRELMETMVLLDLPQRDGIRRCARIASAKIVETKIEVLFDELAAYRQQHPLPKLPKPLELVKPKQPKVPKTTITISEMTRFNPMKTAKIMLNDLLVHGGNPLTVAHYLSNALKTQFLNEVLTVDKQIDPFIFTPVLKKIYAQPQWSTEMVAYLADLQSFFSPTEYLAIVQRGKTAGRQAAARLFYQGDHPNDALIDAHFQHLHHQAQEAVQAFKAQEKALMAKLSRLAS